MSVSLASRCSICGAANDKPDACRFVGGVRFGHYSGSHSSPIVSMIILGLLIVSCAACFYTQQQGAYVVGQPGVVVQGQPGVVMQGGYPGGYYGGGYGGGAGVASGAAAGFVGGMVVGEMMDSGGGYGGGYGGGARGYGRARGYEAPRGGSSWDSGSYSGLGAGVDLSFLLGAGMLGLTVWNMGGGGRPEGWSLGALTHRLQNLDLWQMMMLFNLVQQVLGGGRRRGGYGGFGGFGRRPMYY